MRFWLAAEAKELREKVAKHEKWDNEAKNTSKSRGSKPAAAANKRVFAIEVELKQVK